MNPLKTSLSESSRKKTNASGSRVVEAVVVASVSTPPSSRRLKITARCSKNTSDSKRSTKGSKRGSSLRPPNVRKRTA
jgi:hypothetical protein